MKKLKTIIGILFILAFFGWVVQTLGLAPKTETPKEVKVSSESSSNEQKKNSSNTETSSSEETKSSSSSRQTYNVADMNVKITDSFNEAVQFNQGGEDGYEWTAHIYEIKLKENGAINATVNDSFLNLTDTEKTEVLNSVSRAVNAVVFLETEENRPYFITAYDTNGNKVAQSHVSNVLKYSFK